MTPHRSYFQSYIPWPSTMKSQHVILANGKTKLPISGIGTIKIMVSAKVLMLAHILHAPLVSCSLFSLKEHMRHLGCAQYGETNNLHLFFLTFSIKASVSEDIVFDASPTTNDADFISTSCLEICDNPFAFYHLLLPSSCCITPSAASPTSVLLHGETDHITLQPLLPSHGISSSSKRAIPL